MVDAFNQHGVFSGVDMYHQLHCLNSLRKVIASTMDDEFSKVSENLMELHIENQSTKVVTNKTLSVGI